MKSGGPILMNRPHPPSPGPLPALALTKALDDLLERRWGSWVGASALDSGAFVKRLTRGALGGGWSSGPAAARGGSAKAFVGDAQ